MLKADKVHMLGIIKKIILIKKIKFMADIVQSIGVDILHMHV